MIYGGSPANDEMSNRLYPKNAICYGTMAMTFHVLGDPSADPRFESYSLRLIIRWITSIDRSDWSIAWTGGNSMHGPFLQIKSHINFSSCFVSMHN